MISGIPRPVKPRPTRRLLLASAVAAAAADGASSTLSSNAHGHTSPSAKPVVKAGFVGKRVLMKRVRLIEPRQRSVGRQRLLRTGVGAGDGFTVGQVVVRLIWSRNSHRARHGRRWIA